MVSKWLGGHQISKRKKDLMATRWSWNDLVVTKFSKWKKEKKKT